MGEDIRQNENIDVPASLRALADKIESEEVHATEADFGHANSGDSFDLLTMSLRVDYILANGQRELPSVVKLRDEPEQE